MQEPNNEAARLVVASRSILVDLQEQMRELQEAKDRHIALIESLTPVAEWLEVDEEQPGDGSNVGDEVMQ